MSGKPSTQQGLVIFSFPAQANSVGFEAVVHHYAGWLPWIQNQHQTVSVSLEGSGELLSIPLFDTDSREVI